MEYPLTADAIKTNINGICLNPCSNGIPSDSKEDSTNKDNDVLILVLMEYPLTP